MVKPNKDNPDVNLYERMNDFSMPYINGDRPKVKPEDAKGIAALIKASR